MSLSFRPKNFACVARNVEKLARAAPKVSVSEAIGGHGFQGEAVSDGDGSRELIFVKLPPRTHGTSTLAAAAKSESFWS